ncbi:MAG: ABC transporter permease subunit [Candidatus Dormibacteraeota bacterium]|nr:ABC transporter permease subunit [Candidatus Dormibacteraeota bacterium]
MHAFVLRRNVVDQWRALAAFGAGLLLLALAYLAFYPSIHNSGTNIQQLLNTLPAGLRDAFLGAGVDYNTPSGYIGTELFAVILPVILVALAIVNGSRALAGEEGNGTLDLVLSAPLRRSRLVVEKAVSVSLPLLALGAAVWVMVIAVGPAFGITVSPGGLAVAILANVLMALGFGLLAMLVAGATGSRGLGAGVAAALAVLLYVINALGSAVLSVQGVTSAVSPFHWRGGPGVLVTGVDWQGMAALIVAPLVLLALSVVAFDRRDLHA